MKLVLQRHHFLIFIFLIIYTFSNAQLSVIDSILLTHAKEFSQITNNVKKYKVQIIYSRIDRDANNKAVITDYHWNVDENNYFYCASMVKLPCSIYALEKINGLGISGLDMNTSMITDSAGPCQKSYSSDTSSLTGVPNLAHYIKKMLLVSDNHAYSRVYEFLNPEYIQERNKALNMPKMRITHRFDGNCKGTENLNTNPVHFVDEFGKTIYSQPQFISSKTYTHPLGKVEVGKAYKTNNGKLIKQPKDFSSLNFIPLQNIHDILKSLIFSSSLPLEKQYKITNEQRSFLLKNLSSYPFESIYPKYNRKEYFDSYKKYLLFGDSKENIKEKNIKIFNIVGQSYGFMADCAYIIDLDKKIEFMLSAVIYTNEDEVINDGKYEYNSVALPFLGKLGRAFYQYELNRARRLPNLSEFDIK